MITYPELILKSENPKMKIINMKCHVVEIPLSKEFRVAHSNAPLRSFPEYLVEVDTDEGISGVGSCGFYQLLPNWDKYLETCVKPFLLEEISDPCSIEKFVNHYRVKPFGVDISPRPSCVELALWDIIGKKANLPIYKLLGGTKNKIKAYASVLEPYPLLTVKEWVKFVRDIYSEGFKAVKLHIGAQYPDPKNILDVVKAIRDDLGNNIEIMVDVMQAWLTQPYDFPAVLKLARGLEDYGVTWLEEPLPHINNPDLSARLCNVTDIEIAGGGAMFGWPAYKNLLERDALDIVQPDVQFAGGISEVRRIAFLAEVYGKRCIPHFFGSGIALAATLHVCSLIDSPYIEYPYHPPYITPESRDAMLQAPIKIDKNGYVDVPEGPGLGIKLKDSWKSYLCK
ncbi:MAG: mandelate racemase/muconate lactonizing enzyme family protein [Gammaproteobacteria bacterium]|nr:mandelate racemase/muconate lactonizing enzyme family protein [Gammaproteobacteria bacterium]